MVGQVVIGGIQVIDHKTDMMPTAGKTIREWCFFCPKAEQCNITGGQYSLMAIIAHNRHPQYLAKKSFGILAISHRYCKMVKAKVRPGALLRRGCYLANRAGLNVKCACVEVCDALPNKHIRKDLIAVGRRDANAMPNEQSWRQRMFQCLVKNLLGIDLGLIGLIVYYQRYMQR